MVYSVRFIFGFNTCCAYVKKRRGCCLWITFNWLPKCTNLFINHNCSHFFYSFLNNSFINNSSYSKCTLNLCWYWFSLLNKTFNIQWKVKNKCFVVYIILNIVKTITNLTFNHFPTYTTRVCEEKLTKLKTIKVLILAISFIYKAFLNS